MRVTYVPTITYWRKNFKKIFFLKFPRLARSSLALFASAFFFGNVYRKTRKNSKITFFRGHLKFSKSTCALAAYRKTTHTTQNDPYDPLWMLFEDAHVVFLLFFWLLLLWEIDNNQTKIFSSPSISSPLWNAIKKVQQSAANAPPPMPATANAILPPSSSKRKCPFCNSRIYRIKKTSTLHCIIIILCLV